MIIINSEQRIIIKDREGEWMAVRGEGFLEKMVINKETFSVMLRMFTPEEIKEMKSRGYRAY